MTEPTSDDLATGESGPLCADETFVERPSPLSFDMTVERLSQAIIGAGMRIFAVIDHAENAQEAGLSMPGSTVIIYGKATGGTPIMLETPHSALDLPLHVLVRADNAGQSFVAFHPIVPLLKAAGVPEPVAARLAPAQKLLLQAIMQ